MLKCTRHCNGSIENAPINMPCPDCRNKELKKARIAGLKEAVGIFETYFDLQYSESPFAPIVVREFAKAIEARIKEVESCEK